MRHLSAALFVALLAWAAAPARAQLQDLIHEVEHGALSGDQPVTLTLDRVLVADAVAELAEATGLELACAPGLPKRTLTLVARDRPRREVAAALARVARARWRRDGQSYVLDPASAKDLILPEEASSELQALLVPKDAPAGWTRLGAENHLLSLFAPQQAEAMQAKEGVPFALLLPVQQQEIRRLLAARTGNAVQDIARDLGAVTELQEAMVAMSTQRTTIIGRNADGSTARQPATRDQLEVRTPSGGVLMMLTEPTLAAK